MDSEFGSGWTDICLRMYLANQLNRFLIRSCHTVKQGRDDIDGLVRTDRTNWKAS